MQRTFQFVRFSRVSHGIVHGHSLHQYRYYSFLYERLGFREVVDDEKKVKDMYYRQVMINHPDMASTEEKKNYENRFKEINDAYKILSDSVMKSKYMKQTPEQCEKFKQDWVQKYGNASVKSSTSMNSHAISQILMKDSISQIFLNFLRIIYRKIWREKVSSNIVKEKLGNLSGLYDSILNNEGINQRARNINKYRKLIYHEIDELNQYYIREAYRMDYDEYLRKILEYVDKKVVERIVAGEYSLEIPLMHCTHNSPEFMLTGYRFGNVATRSWNINYDIFNISIKIPKNSLEDLYEKLNLKFPEFVDLKKIIVHYYNNLAQNEMLDIDEKNNKIILKSKTNVYEMGNYYEILQVNSKNRYNDSVSVRAGGLSNINYRLFRDVGLISPLEILESRGYKWTYCLQLNKLCITWKKDNTFSIKNLFKRNSREKTIATVISASSTRNSVNLELPGTKN